MHFKQRLGDALVTGAVTTAVTTTAALAVSAFETSSAASGLNATSHIAWGDPAATVDGFDARHTLLGAALNAGAMLAWSVIHAALPQPRHLVSAVTKGVALSGIAYLTDYHLVPARLTPGFEKRFSARGMAFMYGVLACAFVLGGSLGSKARR